RVVVAAPLCEAIASPTGRRLQLGISMNDYAKLPPRLTRIFANNPVFFVTFCTRRRRKLLATKSVNAAFVEFGIRAHAEQNVAVGRYVIMPDHLHLFVCGADDFQLGGWIGMLKQHLGTVMGQAETARASWRRGCLDQLLRCADSYGQKWNYVGENHFREGLVLEAEDLRYAWEVVGVDCVET